MSIHKEGFKIIFVTFALCLAIALVFNIFFTEQSIIHYILYIILLCKLIFVIRFFRIPNRVYKLNDTSVISPADGTVVVIEEVDNSEYYNDKRIQVSIFMSVSNVHVNRYPISGNVKFVKYFKGKFLIASKPKSSMENERTSVVIENPKISILMRQIAGFIARRIVCYSLEGANANQCDEMGFIKFGSRVDLLLPINADIKVKLNQKVVGGITEIARLS